MDSFTIIRASRLIATITGTVGWEALLLGKQVITFGDVYYNALSMAEKCTEIEKLPLIIKDRLETRVFDEHELECFVGATLEESIDIRLWELWDRKLEPTAAHGIVSRLCELIMSKVSV